MTEILIIFFSFQVGETKKVVVILNIKNKFKIVNEEWGNYEVEILKSLNFEPSKYLLKSNLSHCCGESPFDSFRTFQFLKDSILLVDNYIKYDPSYCNTLNSKTEFEPENYLSIPYYVFIEIDSYNIRFSSDMNPHNSDFVKVPNKNIIDNLKYKSKVKVLAEVTRDDKLERNWLYIEADSLSIMYAKGGSSLNYGFKNQKIRGWISDKFTTKFLR